MKKISLRRGQVRLLPHPLDQRQVPQRGQVLERVVQHQRIAHQDHLLSRPAQRGVEHVPGELPRELHRKRHQHLLERAALRLVDRQRIGEGEVLFRAFRQRDVDAVRALNVPDNLPEFVEAVA